MTYRLDSEYPVPYGRFTPTTNASERFSEAELEAAYAKKTNLVFALISECKRAYVQSGRFEYIAELSKYMPVLAWGKCYKHKCGGKCAKELEESSYFVLAFENTVCDDYASEKFFRMKRLVVPVVLKRSVLRNVAPGDTFIAADDFAHPRELAAFLNATAANKTRYMRYFEWTKRYAKDYYRNVGEYVRDAYCELCRDLWVPPLDRAKRRRRRGHDDMSTWWRASTQCYRDYGIKLLGPSFNASTSSHSHTKAQKRH